MRRKKELPAISILLLMFTMILSGCGAVGGSGNTAAGKTEESTGSTGTAANETRVFETDKGPIEIPAKPQRIITDYYTGALLSVETTVVGSGSDAFKNPYIEDQMKDIKDVGTPINAESVLELQPDLIVVMYDDQYEQLSKIAPTVHIPFDAERDIYKTVELFADLTGHPEKGKQFISKYEEKAAAGREKIKGIIDENATFGIYELTPKNELYAFGDNAGRGGQALYSALGLKAPASIQKELLQGGEGTKLLSLEALPQYASDYIFLTNYDPDGSSESLEKLKKSGVWRNLDAVKNNRFFSNDFDTFYPYDPIAISEQIDLFADMLIQREEENKSGSDK
ncbi:ABC transporter substrate-binding protein [Paenibacillus jiagnxiensis]|uniref:ABC transporter substrate-binding protein n=1 Tax=Paenibacillus jiagnxiensis TaxID=3228926 RepID=UPI0033B78CC6